MVRLLWFLDRQFKLVLLVLCLYMCNFRERFTGDVHMKNIYALSVNVLFSSKRIFSHQNVDVV